MDHEIILSGAGTVYKRFTSCFTLTIMVDHHLRKLRKTDSAILVLVDLHHQRLNLLHAHVNPSTELKHLQTITQANRGLIVRIDTYT